MEGAGIFDGDMAVVDRSVVEDGPIVIAAVKCEPVCKRHVDDAMMLSS